MRDPKKELWQELGTLSSNIFEIIKGIESIRDDVDSVYKFHNPKDEKVQAGLKVLIDKGLTRCHQEAEGAMTQYCIATAIIRYRDIAEEAAEEFGVPISNFHDDRYEDADDLEMMVNMLRLIKDGPKENLNLVRDALDRREAEAAN